MPKIARLSILLILLPLITVGSPLWAADCQKHKVFCQIVALKPNIDKDFAMKLSNYIGRLAAKNGTDPLLTVAIAMQENSFNNKTVTRTSSVQEDTCENGTCTMTIKTKSSRDYGLFQINEGTAQQFGCDLDYLRHDLEHQVECHFKVLKAKMKMCSYLGPEAWSCYHSITEEFRQQYVKDVRRYMK